MKRCPQCHRVETDDKLAFCRNDGVALINDSGSFDSQTAKLGSGPVSSEIETSLLPHTSTTPEANRSTGPTTALPGPQAQGATRELSKPNRTRVLIALAGLTVVVAFLAGYFYWSRKSSTAIQSIAVMPFVNGSGNADLDYLSDGMTETLIRSLSQLPNFNVKARSSVFRYKGRESDAKTIGKELGVPAILNGRFTQRGDQLNLNLELIDTQTENVIWTDQYDRKSSDLVTLQNQIARDVTSKLKIQLTSADQLKLVKSYTNDPEVYRLYLQGRFYWNKRQGSEFEKAESYFRQAIEKDPNFALGFVGLADTSEDEDRPRKKEYIRRALALDDQLAEAHASLGYQYMLDYNWAESERQLARAMELNPNYAQAHQWNGARLFMLGKYDESLISIKRALEIDPTSTGINFYYGILLFVSGKVDESVLQFKRLAEMEPTFSWTHNWLSRIYRQIGNRAAAVDEQAKAAELEGSPEKARLLRESFAKAGWTGYLNQFIKLRADQSPMHRATSIGEASVLAELGEREQVMDVLTRAMARGDFWLFTIKTDRHFDSLRGDKRFQELVNKFNPAE